MEKSTIDSFESLDAALLHACEHCDAPLAREALLRGADPNAVDGEQASAALIASHSGALECLAELLARGVSLAHPRRHYAPTYLAAMAGHEDCLLALIEAGANVKDKDGEGRTCASWAAKHGMARALKMLGKAGAPMDVSIQNGDRPILIAAQKGDLACLDALLGCGVRPGHDTNCSGSESPLIAAAGSGQADVVERLLKAGADPTYKAYSTPLAAAAGSGSLTCLMAILEALGLGKDGKRRKRGKLWDSTMPLLNAALGGHADCVDAILEAGSPSKVRSGLTSADMFYLKQGDIEKAQAFVDCIVEAKGLEQSIQSASKASARKRL